LHFKPLDLEGVPMTRVNTAVAVVLAGALAACQQKAPDQSALQAENEALKKRVEALEQQQAPAQPAAVPLEGAPAVGAGQPFAAPTPGAQPMPQAVRPAPRAAAPKPRTAARRPAPVPVETDREARVERIRPPAAEPMVGTGDPGPRRERLELEPGTELQIVLETALSSETANEGDPVVARVERATDESGRTALPGGTLLKGTVYRADSAGRVKGRSQLAVDFNRLVVRGREYRVDTTAILAEGPASHKRDAAIVGGSTAAGAIIGGIADGGKGARKGAIIGAVGGAGAVLATKGREIEMPSGSRWTVQVKNGVRID
jgi:hypothetical protein